MNKGPIKYQDLYASDVQEGLARLLVDFEKLDSVSQSLAKSIISSKVRINISIKEQKQALKESNDELENTVVSGKHAGDALSKLGKIIDDNITSTNRLKDRQTELDRAFDHSVASVDAIKSRIKALSTEFEVLGRAEDKDKVRLASLASEISKLRTEQDRLISTTKKAKEVVELADGSYAKIDARIKELRANLRLMPNAINTNTGAWNKSDKAVMDHVQQIEKLDRALKKADATLGLHNRKVGDYGSVVGVAGQALSGWVASQLSAVAVLQYSFDQSLKFDSVKSSLTAILASEDLMNQKMKDLRQSASDLGLQYGTLANSYKSFTGATKASNISLEESDRVFLAVSKAANYYKLTNEQLEGALLSIQQMYSKGTVQAEELRGQLSERLPGAFATAAKAMGVTERALGEMMKKGEVLASDLLPKLAGELEKLPLPKPGLQAAWNTFLSTFQQGFGDDSRISSFFTTILQGLNNITSTLFKTVNSTGWNEFFARLTDNKTADVIRDLNTSFATGNKVAKSSFEFDVSKASAQQVKTQYDVISGAYSGATKALNTYKKAIAEKKLEKGGYTELDDYKNLKQYTQMVDVLGAKLGQLSIFLPKAAKTTTQATKTISDSALTSVKEIRKRISDLQALPESAIAGSAVDVRIKTLQDRLKALKTDTAKSVEGFAELQKQITKLETEIEQGLLDGKASDADNALIKKYKTLQEQLKKLIKLKNELINPTPAMGKVNDLPAINLDTNTESSLSRTWVDWPKMIQDNQDNLKELEDRYEVSLDLRVLAKKRNVRKELEEDRKYVDEKYFLDQLDFAYRQRNLKEGSKEWNSIERQKTKAYAKYQRERHEIDVKAQEEYFRLVDETLSFFRENNQIISNLFGSEFGAIFDSITDSLEDFLVNGKMTFEQWAEFAVAAIDLVAQRFNSASEARVKQLEEQKDREVKLAGDNVKAKEAIESLYNQKIKEEKRKQARTAKLAAMFEIALNTAVAATKVVGQTGIFGLPLVPIMLALGAVQLGLVAAQPIPEFWKGTDNAPEGLAWIAEKGPEIIEKPSGERKLVKEKSMHYLDRGSKVYNNPKTQKMLENQQLSNQLEINHSLTARVAEARRRDQVDTLAAAMVMSKMDENKFGEAVGKRIAELPITNWSVNEKGFVKSIRKGNTTVTMINERYSLK